MAPHANNGHSDDRKSLYQLPTLYGDDAVPETETLDHLTSSTIYTPTPTDPTDAHHHHYVSHQPHPPQYPSAPPPPPPQSPTTPTTASLTRLLSSAQSQLTAQATLITDLQTRLRALERDYERLRELEAQHGKSYWEKYQEMTLGETMVAMVAAPVATAPLAVGVVVKGLEGVGRGILEGLGRGGKKGGTE